MEMIKDNEGGGGGEYLEGSDLFRYFCCYSFAVGIVTVDTAVDDVVVDTFYIIMVILLLLCYCCCCHFIYTVVN